MFFDSTVVNALQNIDNEKLLTGSVKKDVDKYDRYCKALDLLKIFLSKNNRGNAIYDDPNLRYSWHSVVISFENDEYDKNDIHELSEIINAFDGMMMVGSSSGYISFSMLMNNIYKKGK